MFNLLNPRYLATSLIRVCLVLFKKDQSTVEKGFTVGGFRVANCGTN